MAFGKDHELHERRFSRSLWVGLLLAGFVALVFGLTFVKVTRQAPEGGFAMPANPLERGAVEAHSAVAGPDANPDANPDTGPGSEPAVTEERR